MSGNHKHRPNLTDIEIAKILTLDHTGSSQRDIAGDVHRSKSAVQHALSEYDYDTFTGHNPRPKRARKTTKREDRYLIRAAKQFDEVPLRDITNIVGIPVSQSTLSRRLHEEGLGRYVARRKPGLRPENVEERLNWAIAHKDWTIEDWKRVIWSDETIIVVGHNSRRQWVTRPKGEALNPKYVKPTYKGERVTLMVWACFCGDRLGPLIVCDEGGVGGDEYMDILYDGLFSLIDDLVESPEQSETIRVCDENPFIFMQDNATCHKATEVLELLKEHEIPVMRWPAQSPDLNPIENLWIDFKDRFHKRYLEIYTQPSKSMDAKYRYSELLKEVWREQGLELVNKLIESMPKRCKLVIEAKGLWTKY